MFYMAQAIFLFFVPVSVDVSEAPLPLQGRHLAFVSFSIPADVRRIKLMPLPARRWRRHVGPTVAPNSPPQHGHTPVEQVASVSQSFHDDLPSSSVPIVT